MTPEAERIERAFYAIKQHLKGDGEGYQRLMEYHRAWLTYSEVWRQRVLLVAGEN